MWNEFTTDKVSLQEVLNIIDDALCFGFEFKVEKHKIYYREVV